MEISEEVTKRVEFLRRKKEQERIAAENKLNDLRIQSEAEVILELESIDILNELNGDDISKNIYKIIKRTNLPGYNYMSILNNQSNIFEGCKSAGDLLKIKYLIKFIEKIMHSSEYKEKEKLRIAKLKIQD